MLRASGSGLSLDREAITQEAISLLRDVNSTHANRWSFSISAEWVPSAELPTGKFSNESCRIWLPDEHRLKLVFRGATSTVIGGTPLLQCAHSGHVDGYAIFDSAAPHCVRGGAVILRVEMAIKYRDDGIPDASYVLFDRIDKAIQPGW